jgi:hypothetical protein
MISGVMDVTSGSLHGNDYKYPREPAARPRDWVTIVTNNF